MGEVGEGVVGDCHCQEEEEQDELTVAEEGAEEERQKWEFWEAMAEAWEHQSWRYCS